MAPIGSCFVAWGDEALRSAWMAPVAHAVGADQFAALRRVPDLVRERGYAIATGHDAGAHLESVATRINAGDPQVSATALRQAFIQALDGYNQPQEPDREVELRSLSAPVFAADHHVAYMLTLWGRTGYVTPAEVRDQAALLLDAAAAASRAITVPR
jgi:DNA-binding IclR family transcriptional regulator